jgi:3-isopropylmalate/(R)-2-methylmalate dehydratase large subunit
VANTLAGVRAGARQIECTVNALGERAGNASLEEVVMAIRTRPDIYGCRTRVDTRQITHSSRMVSACTGIAVPPNKAVVGANAFAHESGIHQDGMLKHHATYEIMTPESVGAGETRLVLGKHSGRSAVTRRLQQLGVTLADDAVDAVFDRFKTVTETIREVDDTTLLALVPKRPRTTFEKIWDAHVVQPQTASTPAVVYVDLHLVHEVTSAQAFTELERRGLRVRHRDRTIATMDHSTPTAIAASARGALPVMDAAPRAQLEQLARNCERHGIPLYPLGDDRQGIVHVIGPELGATQPGMTIVCGDSHTSTHGAFGALAFGIGTSQVAHVLATQCVLQQRPKTLRVHVSGRLRPGVTAKDLILAIIGRIGISGGTGHVIEYCGPAISALTMEQRMTVCNMSIEAGARAGLIAPDDVTFEYLAGREFVPTGAAWEEAVAQWRALQSDDDAVYDNSVEIDGDAVEPMITFGTNPGMSVAIGGHVPNPASFGDAGDRSALTRALAYMGFTSGQSMLGTPINTVFLGSCTNSRLSDLREAAGVLRGLRVAPGVRMLVVPGSQAVKRAAEREGLDRVFVDAGAEWREAGCSMCIAMNGDQLRPGELAVSTSNRNFEGRQGPGGRTLLASPLTAAASAIAGVVADPRPYVGGR